MFMYKISLYFCAFLYGGFRGGMNWGITCMDNGQVSVIVFATLLNGKNVLTVNQPQWIPALAVSVINQFVYVGSCILNAL